MGQTVNSGAANLTVSVVIPAYNAARTIGTTLDSLLSQTHSAWEAVVVNDGSTDHTADIVASYASRDPRVRLITQPNGGESAARNTGLAHTRYGWLLFLDADDWIAAEHLEKLTAALAGDRMLDAVHCAYARVAADGGEIEDRYQPPTGDLFPTLARRAAFPVHACIVRKHLVEEVGGFDPSLRTSPDWDLWQRVARGGANFGAVRDVLAFYRMSPNGASLDARQLFTDGMRVLERGVSADPRVLRPHPSYAQGWKQDPVVTQEFYLLSWCAGLLLGSDRDARSLFDLVDDHRFPELYPDAVAQCLFEAVPLPTCQAPSGWDALWPKLRQRVEDFLVALERQAQAPDLAQKALGSLRRKVLHASPTWSIVQEGLSDMKALFDHERQTWQRLAEERERTVAAHQQLLDDLRRSEATLEADRQKWRQLAEERGRALEDTRRRLEELAANRALIVDQQQQRIVIVEAERDELRREVAQRTAEVEALRRSDERWVGDLLLNRFRLKAAVYGAANIKRALGQSLSVARLTIERYLSRGPQHHRVIATACDVFPIYSQTFVYQELTQLARHDFDVRFVYSKLDAPDLLQSQFAWLWKSKRRLFLSQANHERDFARYQSRMPAKVEHLVGRLCAASGLSKEALVSHGNFLQAFSFTRMVEAYRPAYLHSYFFYDRSLMALVASYLLDIPRGISCYADHVLQDYELKLVPLHLELCDIVIATSERIKNELLQLAPRVDASRILVKPNGIDTTKFPVMERTGPSEGAPFRVIALCRIEPKKGLLDLIETVGLLRQRGLLVEAHIVGTVDEWSQASRDYKTRLDQRITELGLWGKVHLEGRQNLEGILRFLRIADVFVAPFVETAAGDKDGIPTALLEAMSTGIPVVATDAGSIAEVIQHDHNGLLVAQHNPASLADAIQLLLEDSHRRGRFGQEAAELIRSRYDVTVCERPFHDRLRSILATTAR